jgi:hypothetical protein
MKPKTLHEMYHVQTPRNNQRPLDQPRKLKNRNNQQERSQFSTPSAFTILPDGISKTKKGK